MIFKCKDCGERFWTKFNMVNGRCEACHIIFMRMIANKYHNNNNNAKRRKHEDIRGQSDDVVTMTMVSVLNDNVNDSDKSESVKCEHTVGYCHHSDNCVEHGDSSHSHDSYSSHDSSYSHDSDSNSSCDCSCGSD